ncbi:MAG: inverse autotransporter beta domain-containing protein [Cyanobacteria bacterium J06635_1]
MKNPIWYTSATLLVVLMFAGPSVRADETPIEGGQGEVIEGEAVQDETAISQEPTAADLGTDLVIRPRFGLDFDTAGSGAESFGQFESFIPLWQNAGRELLFFQGQLLLDTDENLGTNLQLGYRHYVPSSDRIFGGYVAFDKRGTDNASFDQLGIGVETLGENWDLRLNGFLPIGDQRELVDSNLVDAGTQITNLQFIGNQLVGDAQQQQAEINRFESALGGFDLELGTKLLDIGESGALRGFAGLYYYDGEGVDGSLGWRLRLQAEPTEYLRTGLSVQDDDIFGTTVRFNIGAAFPGYRATSAGADNDTVVARLGESIDRTGHIVIDEQTEVGEVVAAEADVQTGPVTNPATGEPWFFNHVTPDGAAGDGTFETPYNTVADATDTIPTDGNGIIYIADSNGAVIAEDLTIPGGVQLLSTGPEQFIAGFDESIEIQLPFSGSGDFPIIDGTVTMGSSPNGPTVLGGFDIQNDAGPGVIADSLLGDIVISDNIVTTAGEEASAGIDIDVDDSTTAGGITILNNVVNAADDDSIEIDINDTTLTGDIVISGNTLNSTEESEYSDDSIDIDTYYATIIGDISISGNTLTADEGGVDLDFNYSTTTGDVEISGNTIDAGDTGVDVYAYESTLTGDITVTDNEIANSGISASFEDSDLTGDITISENVIENGYSYGIGLNNFRTTLDGDVVISGNVIDAEGFGIIASNYSYSDINGELLISDNVIGTEAAETSPYGGITLFNVESTIDNGVTISGNTVQAQAFGIGIINDTGRGEVTSEIAGGITITGNSDIQVDSSSNYSYGPFGQGATGVAVFNNDSLISGGVNISENGPIQVLADDEIAAVGIVVFNADGQIEGGVAINNNESVDVAGANTDINPTDPSDFGTAAIAVVNYSYEGGGSSIDEVTISGNTNIESSEYGIVVGNAPQLTALVPDAVVGDITIANNGIVSVDDGVLVANLDEIDGSVIISGNTIVSDEDDGIDLSNGIVIPDIPPIVLPGTITGDVFFTDNTITADGDDIKCTNIGTIAGNEPLECQND